MTNNINNINKSNIDEVDYNLKNEILLKSDNETKLKYVNELMISYPKLIEVMEDLEKCQKSIETSSYPECLLLTGPTRVGKSSIINAHSEKYPDLHTAEGIIIPILYSIVPCPAYIGGLVPQLLSDLGDPFYYKGRNIIEKKLRLYKLLKACEVRLIVLDEVQHLVDRNSEKLLRDSADFFKLLLMKLKFRLFLLD